MTHLKKRFYLFPVFFLFLSIILMLLEGSHLTVSAVTIVLRQGAILGMLSTGLGLVVLIGEIDLSIGAMMALSSGLSAAVLMRCQGGLLLCVIVPVLVCTLLGLLNGLLVAHFHFSAAVVTLAQSLACCGIGMFFNQSISTLTSPPLFYRIFNGTLLGIPTGAIVWVVLLLIVSLCLRYTYWGQYIYAIGANEQALLLIGVNTTRYKLLTFAACGFFAGLAGVFMLARVSISINSVNVSLLLEVVTAISLGGLGFSGAYGKLPGLLLGTISVTVCKMCMTSYAVPSTLQSMGIALLFLLSLFAGRKL